MAEYIDREAFKKSVEECYCKPCKAEGKDHNGCWCRACWVDDMLDEVECFQPSDVAPVVHGRWITWEEAGNDMPSPHRHECSVCHDAAQVLINGIELLSDYCPDCGAIMDGDAERRNT